MEADYTYINQVFGLVMKHFFYFLSYTIIAIILFSEKYNPIQVVFLFYFIFVCDFHSIAQASALVKHVVLLIQALRMLHHKQLLSNVSL